MDIFVGTYSQPLAGMAGNGEGIYTVAFDPATGAFGTPQLLAECVNPSSLVLSPDGSTLFVGKEVFADNTPALLSFQIASSGALTLISHKTISGTLPCHLAFDPVKGRLASAQYGTGDVTICNVTDGVFQGSPVYLNRKGNGPNKARQEGPHAHHVAFSDAGEVLHLVDLGTDSIVSYCLGSDNRPVAEVILHLPAGCGPRHMALTRNAARAFVLCELDESLITLTRAGLGWEIVNVQAGFAPPMGEDGSGAAIRLASDERHIYLSGRRQARIAYFAANDAVMPLGEVDCGGLSPREFILTSNAAWVIVANQNSNTLTSLRRASTTGLLTVSEHSCAIGSPVALAEKIS